MKIHKEGVISIIIVTIFNILLIIAAHKLFETVWAYYLSYAISAFLFIAILQFFRNPGRTIPIHANHVICPADGRVVVIEEVMEGEYLNEKRMQLSVFMSPTNVHVNRYPISGKVTYVKYHPGKYLVAWHPKSSTENERSTIVVEDENKRSVLFRQIAGAMARRIVYYCKEGDLVHQGDQCGFIKFGSRVDVFLPMDAKIHVNLNEKVRGGETVLASY